MPRRTLQLDGTEHDISNLVMQPIRHRMYPIARLLTSHDVEDIGRIGTTSPPRITPQERLSATVGHMRLGRLVSPVPPVPPPPLLVMEKTATQLQYKKENKCDTLGHIRLAHLLSLAPPPPPLPPLPLVIEKTEPQQYKQEDTALESSVICDDYIKVSDGLILPLCSAKETIRALGEKRIARYVCLFCSQVVGCMETAHYVLCPQCRCIMRTGIGNGEGYVGLGFCYEKYLPTLRMTGEVVAGVTTAAACI